MPHTLIDRTIDAAADWSLHVDACTICSDTSYRVAFRPHLCPTGDRLLTTYEQLVTDADEDPEPLQRA